MSLLEGQDAQRFANLRDYDFVTAAGDQLAAKKVFVRAFELASDAARARSATVRRKRAVQRARVALGQVQGWETMIPGEIVRSFNRMGIPIASRQGEWTCEKAKAAIQLVGAA